MEQSTSPIKKTWSLLAFAREFGPIMDVGEFINGETSEEFSSCIFTSEKGTKTFVAFSHKLGVLTPREIATLKDDLQVVQLESGKYKLCKKGSISWQRVDLGI